MTTDTKTVLGHITTVLVELAGRSRGDNDSQAKVDAALAELKTIETGLKTEIDAAVAAAFAPYEDRIKTLEGQCAMFYDGVEGMDAALTNAGKLADPAPAAEAAAPAVDPAPATGAPAPAAEPTPETTQA